MGEQDRVMDYRSSLVASEEAQGNLTPVANPNIDNLQEGVDDDDAVGGTSILRVGLKRKVLDLQDRCRTKKQKVPTEVA